MRAKLPKANLFGDLRRSTLICCRRTRISASSRALERHKPGSADHSSMRTSTIGHEHHPIRLLSPTVQGFRQGHVARRTTIAAAVFGRDGNLAAKAMDVTRIRGGLLLD